MNSVKVHQDYQTRLITNRRCKGCKGRPSHAISPQYCLPKKAASDSSSSFSRLVSDTIIFEQTEVMKGCQTSIHPILSSLCFKPFIKLASALFYRRPLAALVFPRKVNHRPHQTHCCSFYHL